MLAMIKKYMYLYSLLRVLRIRIASTLYYPWNQKNIGINNKMKNNNIKSDLKYTTLFSF